MRKGILAQKIIIMCNTLMMISKLVSDMMFEESCKSIKHACNRLPATKRFGLFLEMRRYINMG